MAIQLQRDLVGQIVPFGKCERYLDENFLILPAAPSNPTSAHPWLEIPAASGTGSWTAPGSGLAKFRMTSGATSGNIATLQTAMDLNITNCRAVAWTVEGLVMDTDSALYDISFGIIGTNSANYGGQVRQLYTEDTVTMQVLNGGGDQLVSTATHFRSLGEGTKRHNWTCLLDVGNKKMFLLADDQVWGHIDCSAKLGTGTCRPRIRLITRENVAHYFEVSRVKLTWWTN